MRQAVPHIGYRLAVKLAEAGIIHSVWTPNFDGLATKAASQSKIISSIEVGIDSQERLFRKPRRSELVCVSLHGDYRYDALKNTPQELQQQEEMLRGALVEQLKDIPLLVSGYSGRDASLMAALRDAYSRPGTGALYWSGFSDEDIPEDVRRLIITARGEGRGAYYIPSGGSTTLCFGLRSTAWKATP